MEIGPVKTKVMANDQNDFQREIKTQCDCQSIEAAVNFKYLGSVISNDGFKPEILSGIAQITATLSRRKITWRDKNSSLAS